MTNLITTVNLTPVIIIGIIAIIIGIYIIFLIRRSEIYKKDEESKEETKK